MCHLPPEYATAVATVLSCEVRNSRQSEFVPGLLSGVQGCSQSKIPPACHSESLQGGAAKLAPVGNCRESEIGTQVGGYWLAASKIRVQISLETEERQKLQNKLLGRTGGWLGNTAKRFHGVLCGNDYLLQT